jgi:hypothetical protein
MPTYALSTVVTLIRYCTLYLCTPSLTRWLSSGLVTLSLLFSQVTITVSFYSVHFIGYNFSSASRLDFTLKSTNATALNVEHIRFLVVPFFGAVFVVFAQFQLLHAFFDPGPTPTQCSFLCQVFIF